MIEAPGRVSNLAPVQGRGFPHRSWLKSSVKPFFFFFFFFPSPLLSRTPPVLLYFIYIICICYLLEIGLSHPPFAIILYKSKENKQRKPGVKHENGNEVHITININIESKEDIHHPPLDNTEHRPLLTIQSASGT